MQADACNISYIGQLYITTHTCKFLIMSDFDIRKIRKELGLSQEDFAKKLGVTTRTIQNWESGGKIPNSKHEIIHDLQIHKIELYGDQTNINGNNYTSNATLLEKALEEITEQRKIIAKSQEQIDILLSLLADKESKK